MFTGIIKGIGFVSKMVKEPTLLHYAVELPAEFLVGLELGASLSIDGICQTVVSVDKEARLVWFDAIEETLARTTLKYIELGMPINFERAAKIGDEIGGHLLSGHIYGTTRLVDIVHNVFTFECHPQWRKFLFLKGFIAIDGISLTLASVKDNQFAVHLIPETLKRTTLGNKKVGDLVNIELDALTQAAVETIENLYNHLYTSK